MTQLDFLKLDGRGIAFGGCLIIDRDLDQISAGSDSSIHAARGNKFGLVARVSLENSKDGHHVRIVNTLLISLKETRHMTAAQAGLTRDVCLLEPLLFRDAVQSSAEVAHNFFVQRVPFYGNSDLMQ